MLNIFRVDGLETDGVDLTRLKFASSDLARKLCRLEIAACGYSYTNVEDGMVENVCEQRHCGFNSDRYVSDLVGLIETLGPVLDAPDELEAGPNVGDGTDFDVHNA